MLFPCLISFRVPVALRKISSWGPVFSGPFVLLQTCWRTFSLALSHIRFPLVLWMCQTLYLQGFTMRFSLSLFCAWPIPAHPSGLSVGDIFSRRLSQSANCLPLLWLILAVFSRCYTVFVYFIVFPTGCRLPNSKDNVFLIYCYILKTVFSSLSWNTIIHWSMELQMAFFIFVFLFTCWD